MNVIRLFRNYIDEHHPQLAGKDWIVDVRVISVSDIKNEDVKATIPNEITEKLTCWVFFYDGCVLNVVYLLQDKQGLLDLVIGQLKEGELNMIKGRGLLKSYRLFFRAKFYSKGGERMSPINLFKAGFLFGVSICVFIMEKQAEKK
ncbi:hypothetical protein [Bacillus licheniformis]|uniref:hypothetical protein n=1 Tax=Bacillus licheniformis TaxID=1402 RepID=UPI0021593DF3|nr:hypothetical protein [Bacillus licheniformis]